VIKDAIRKVRLATTVENVAAAKPVTDTPPASGTKKGPAKEVKPQVEQASVLTTSVWTKRMRGSHESEITAEVVTAGMTNWDCRVVCGSSEFDRYVFVVRDRIGKSPICQTSVLTGLQIR
jgi:hypothetical protein